MKDKESIGSVTKADVNIISHFSAGDSSRAIHHNLGIYGSFHLSLLPPKDTTTHRVTSRDVAARDRPPTGRSPAAHRPPTGRPPAAHSPPAAHRPPTGVKPCFFAKSVRFGRTELSTRDLQFEHGFKACSFKNKGNKLDFHTFGGEQMTKQKRKR